MWHFATANIDLLGRQGTTVFLFFFSYKSGVDKILLAMGMFVLNKDIFY